MVGIERAGQVADSQPGIASLDMRLNRLIALGRNSTELQPCGHKQHRQQPPQPVHLGYRTPQKQVSDVAVATTFPEM